MLIRAIFYFSKTDFHNIIITKEDWETLKKTGKFGHDELPVLEYNSKLYTQTHAIESYLAHVFKIHGKTIEDECAINSLLNSYDDLYTIFYHFTFPQNDDDKEHVNDYKSAFQSKFAFYMNTLENKYNKVNKDEEGYFLGKYLSVADLFLCLIVYNFDNKCGKDSNIIGIVKEQAPNILN